MRKWLLKWGIPAVCLLLVVFLGGFLLGRLSTPVTISARTEHPVPVAAEPPEPETVPAQPPQSGLLDLNRATEEELMALPGIGQVLAGRIIEYRNICGGFITVEQLLEIEGIGKAKYAELVPHVTVTVEDKQ